jgi:hypothetical protein
VKLIQLPQTAKLLQETKIFEIACTLLDVINIVPAAQQKPNSLIRQEPLEVFHGLSSLLGSISGGNSHLLTLLQSKIAQSPIPFIPMPRLMEVDGGLDPGSSPLKSARRLSLRSNQRRESLTYVSPDPIQLRSLGMSDWVT